LQNFLRLIFVHDLNRLLFAGSILVKQTSVLVRTRPTPRQDVDKTRRKRGRLRRREDFSHKERVPIGHLRGLRKRF
jgi:hypothetical protein